MPERTTGVASTVPSPQSTTAVWLSAASGSPKLALIATGVPSSPATSFPASTDGGTFIRTVSATVAAADVATPSETVKLKLSAPKKSCAGVYMNAPSAPNNSVPCTGPLASAKLSASPSGSVPVTAPVSTWSSGVEKLAGTATGGALVLTSRATSAVSSPPWPSETV